MDALQIAGAPPGIYRLRGKSPTIYYLDLRHPNSPLFLRIPSPGSNAMDFDRRWEDLHRLTSYSLEDTIAGVVRIGAVHRFDRSPGAWDTPWVRATALESIERLDDDEANRLLVEFPQSTAPDSGSVRSVRRTARRHAAKGDARVLDEQGANDDLDELVEWTTSQSDLLSLEERRDRIERIADEMVTDWRDVFDRLGSEEEPEGR